MSDKTDNPEIADTDCLEAMDHLYAYLNGELSDGLTREKVEHHISHCKSCFTRAELEKLLNKKMKQSSKNETPETLQKRLKDIIKDLE
jgi:anti-sigma factor (TIGR02949 family)